MASSSGKDQDDPIQEPVHERGQRDPQTSSAAAATSTDAPIAAAPGGGADVSSPPPPLSPPAPRVESLTLERAREPLGGGGCGTEGSSSAAAAVDRKGKKVVEISSSSSSPSPSTPSSPVLSDDAADVLSDDAAEDAIRDIEKAMAMRLYWGESGFRPARPKAQKKTEEKSNSQQMKSIWSFSLWYIKNMIFCRKGWQMDFSDLSNVIESPTLVDHQKIHLAYAISHYDLFSNVGGEVSSNLANLLNNYSEFRPVYGDGECFYRSFIISYLEQVLDRQDRREEYRLLATIEAKVKPLAMQIDYPEWASTFSTSHKAFQKLMENVIGWKNTRIGATSTDSYCKQELLKFFSSYTTTDDIFVFLRIAAAIWMCSHRKEYEPHIVGLGEDYTLKAWCAINLVPLREDTDHVSMKALAEALGVPLRVESLLKRLTLDIYTADGVPRVTVLYTGAHYDILYPRSSPRGSPSQGERQSHPGASSSQQVAQGES
ncbi:hypothetical protein ABZP36_023694 [Zizania latifolia]